MIVGYQDAESAGRQLLEGRDELVLDGEAISVSSHIERFYLSAHADRLGIAKHLSGYPSERLVLTHGDGGAREAVFELFRKERHVDRPRAGEWIDLVGETRRRKVAPAPLPASHPAPKRSATRIRRFNTEVVIVRERDRLVLELPETFDKTLIPEGRYRLEAQMAAIATFKLIERPGGVPDISEVEGVSPEVEDREALV